LRNYLVLLLFGLFVLPNHVMAIDKKDALSPVQSSLLESISLAPSIEKPLGNPTVGGYSNGSAQNTKRAWFKAIHASGWARFYPFYRNMKTAYDIPPTNGLTLPVTLNADDGYQQPLMLFKLEGSPSAKTSFETELQFSNLLKRTTTLTDSTGKYANLYVIFKLQGAVDTKFGRFKIIAGGGANWYRLSPSTLWGYQYRDDLFERYPWDPEGHDFTGRYNAAYSGGDIPRDQRFGMQAVQGVILEGTSLPAGFDAAVLYGKTTTSGGFQSYLTKTPQNIFATRIGKAFGLHKLGFNYFDQYGYTGNQVVYKKIKHGSDSVYIEDNRISQLVTTVDARLEFKKISFFTEIGGGSYFDNLHNDGVKDNAKTGEENVGQYKRIWGETAFLEMSTKKELTGIPLKMAIYRISPHVVNNSSSVSNTSVEQAKPTPAVPDNYYTNYYDGMVTDVGQLANNRQGLNVSGTKKFNNLLAKVELGIAQELVNLVGDIRNGARANTVIGNGADSLSKVPFTNSITYEHKLNGLTRSRFGFYQRFEGPYNRIHSIFRRTYENIAITDTIVDYKKSFSTLNLELKYKFYFLGKELILMNYNNYSSVQDQWSPVPIFTDKAFLRIFYEEFLAFYAIHPKLTLVGFAGTERVKGNQRTELADEKGNLLKKGGRLVAGPNGKPIDQTGYGYGLGFDYNFNSRASLHIRNRWFSQEDANFVRDAFKGFETTLEFKVFF
jgi:hypothetical protein